MSEQIQKDLRNSIVLPALTYESETWKLNEVEQYKVRAVEITFIRTACGVTRADRVRNEV